MYWAVICYFSALDHGLFIIINGIWPKLALLSPKYEHKLWQLAERVPKPLIKRRGGGVQLNSRNYMHVHNYIARDASTGTRNEGMLDDFVIYYTSLH